MAESQIIEYKQSWHDEYLKWICGYANAQGGILYIGINDDAEVCGVRDSKKLLEDIPNKIIQSMGIHVEVNLTTRENQDIIEIHVDPFSMPISYNNEVLFGPHTSKPRNKNIAYAFYKMGFIESWGRGFDKITDSFTDAQLSLPTVESKFGGVLTIIPRREQVEGTSNLKREQVEGTSNLERGQVEGTSNLERGQVEGTSNLERGQVTGQVERLLTILTEDMGIQRMMLELKLKARNKFLQNYLNPATMLGLIEMTQPNSPKSPTQKYRLTEKGKQLREQIINDK